VTVRAGGRAFIASDARIVQQRSNAAELDRELAWREGKIDLIGESLAGAVREFNRYNERKIVLIGSDIGRERIDGVFRTDDAEGFALAVHQLLGVEADLSNPHVIRLTEREKISS
jgi:transmembrane sensor